MKRIILAMMTGLVLSATVPTMAQHHRHTPAASISVSNHSSNKGVDSVAIVAFSDTTSNVDDEDTASAISPFDSDMDDMDKISDILQGTFMPIALTFLIFCMTPLIVIGLLVYFVIKTRNQKLRIMELAMKSGQPIPNELVHNNPTDKTLWNKGMLKIFLGVGIFMLGIFVSMKLIEGIGFLVMFYGAGQVVIAYTSKKSGTPDTNGNASNTQRNEEEKEEKQE